MATINEKALKEELISLKQREKEINELLKKVNSNSKISIGLLPFDIFHNFILNSTLNNCVSVRNPSSFHLNFVYDGERIDGGTSMLSLVLGQDNIQDSCIQCGTTNNSASIGVPAGYTYYFTINPKQYQAKNKSTNYTFRTSPYGYGITGMFPMMEYKDK